MTAMKEGSPNDKLIIPLVVVCVVVTVSLITAVNVFEIIVVDSTIDGNVKVVLVTVVVTEVEVCRVVVFDVCVCVTVTFSVNKLVKEETDTET